MTAHPGTLYLVGVPIGNYADMTLRAIETLKKVDIIAAEDTRKTRHLLNHFGIETPQLLAHHAHNEHDSHKGLLDLLAQGKSIALVTDAGMPALSDPGFLLGRVALAAGVGVEVIPGVSAVTTGVVASGLPADRFFFEGFLPRSAGDRAAVLKRLADAPETVVLFESAQRIVPTLRELAAAWGDRHACVCRELTKTHQEFIRGTLAGLADLLAGREVLGEITLVVAGADGRAAPDLDALDADIKAQLARGRRPKEIRDDLAERVNLPKRDLYARILALTGDDA
jgi:16S rRNA (cytidine1402-2'-O)-methyltransferase